MCSPIYVNEVEKRRIAAYAAKFRQATASPFGDRDEIGMLNLIDAESRNAILARADATKVFDLAVDYFVGMPSWDRAGDPGYQIWMTHTPRGEEIDDKMGVGPAVNRLVSYSGDAISMYTHCGTHIDTLTHFGYNGEIFNHYKAADHIGSRTWNCCGAEKHPPIIARGVLLDMAAMHGVEQLPEAMAIGPKDIDDCLKHQGTELKVGDVILIRTGRMNAWPDPQRYMHNPPGLNREGASYLCHAGAVMIGSDTHTLEQAPSADPENWLPVHSYMLCEAGVPLIEIVNLEELSAARLYEFAFFGACLKLRGATGSPMRPVAMPLRA
jgi:kynurenine formamidase